MLRAVLSKFKDNFVMSVEEIGLQSGPSLEDLGDGRSYD